MMENNEEFQAQLENDKHYKIQVGREYFIRRKDIEYDGGTIVNYSIPIAKKVNGRIYNYPKKVRFKTGVNLKDNTKIVINNFFEDVMENKKDRNNPIWHIMVLDFEIVEEPDDVNSAIMDYQNNIENTKIDKEREVNDFICF